MKKFTVIVSILAILISSLSLNAAAVDTTVATIGTASYDTLQAAIDAYVDPTTYIQLVKNTSETITVTEDVHLDLNGCNVTGNVTVTNATLYCMDSQTDDYDIEDDNFGTITKAVGIAGVPEEATCAEDGYLMIEDNNALSFHRVNLQISSMVLRAEDVGVYYKSQFAGDQKVAEQVASYGIALSVQAVPNADNLTELCECSTFTSFDAGANTTNTSTLLKGVMKPTNPDLRNLANSKMKIYGRAYLQTTAGDYMFGAPKSRSFQQQVQAAAADDFWAKLDDGKKESVVNLYRQYAPVLRTWDVANVESAMVLDKTDPLNTTESDSLKVLAITSSFGLNTTQLLYDVAVAEGYDPEKVTVGRLYTSGCTLEKHLTYAPDKPVYQYTKVTGDPTKTDKPGVMQTLYAEGTATLLNGLRDEDWDIIFMQQGAAQAPQLNSYVDASGNDRISQLRAIVDQYKTNPNARFVWNMLWGYQSDSTISPFPTIFRGDQMYMYQCNINAVMKYVVPRTDYDRIIPTGTVIQNARTSEFGDHLCRDTYHLNNYGAVLAAYGLFSVITGQEVSEVNLDIVSVSKTNGISGAELITVPLTTKQKEIIKESVNNALKNPFGVTESKYPARDYSNHTYTENLNFIDNSLIAYCPSCRAEKNWIEINQNNLDSLVESNYLGVTMNAGIYHFYLSSDIEFTAENPNNSFLHAPGGGRNICLHLNGNDLTATNCAVSIMAGDSKLNVMGTGTVSGNHTSTSQFRGSAFVLNSGETTNSGTLRLYSGTYVQPKTNNQLAPISTSFQGGLLEIFEDVTINGNEGTYSVCLNTANNKPDLSVSYPETLNIYGGVFNRPVYAEAFSPSTLDTSLNILGGTFREGIEIVSGAKVTLSGNPVITGAGLKLAEGLTVTLDELTTGASIAVDANGAFTVANSKASSYLTYFTPVQSGYSITESDGVLSCTAG